MFSIIYSNKAVKELTIQLTKEKENSRRILSEYDSYRSEKERQILSLKTNHEIEIQKRQAELDLYETVKTKELSDELVRLKTDLKIAETKLEFMEKITDLNGDVLDVKELVQNLIEKLPTVNINSIIAGMSGAAKKRD